MLLSLSHNFIFVHVTKTAGVAITQALAPFALPKERHMARRVSSLIPHRECPEKVYLRTHDTALWAQRKLGAKEFDRFHSFGVVRNPYSRAVSYYEYYRQNRAHHRHHKVVALDFARYLEGLRASPDTKNVTQTDFLCDRSGTILVREVLRFERLQSSFPALCLRLGVRANLRRANASRQQPITDYYSPQTMALVEDIYAEDFKVFGYRRGALPEAPRQIQHGSLFEVGSLRHVV